MVAGQASDIVTGSLSAQDELAALDLFESALEQDNADLTAFINNAEGVSAAVRDRARALLRASQQTGSSVNTGGAPGDGLRDGLRESAFPAPERIGAYRVLRLLGRGGMGAVYQCERDDDDFDHIVAIKLIKPGILSDNLVERFRRERRILASLRHNHIAQLYDGGETEDGAPYIVMEYVDGASMGDWLKRDKPSLDRRLSLFLQICEAVEFAHQNLIIHRDLTPGNVVVTEGDHAKLIDFGIARPPSEDDAPYPPSHVSKLSLTPGFAAPERSSSDAVTTLADIYSLGRIFELLVEDHEDEDELLAIARKASSTEPEDRYASAALMARDVDAFRRNEPIAAFSTAKRYRVGKYLTRHKLPAAFATAAALAMCGGLIATTLAYREAAQARDAANQRFGEVRELSNFLIFDLYDQLEDVPGTTGALNAIADRARNYLDVLSATKGAPRDVELEAALAYKRLADVLGTPIGANLGRREEAGEALDIAIGQLRRLHRQDPDDFRMAEGLAETLYSRAVYDFIVVDDNEAAHKHASEAAELFWLSAKGPRRAQLTMKAIDAEVEAAQPLAWIGRGREGVKALELTLAKMEAHIAEFGRDQKTVGLLARTETALAETMGRVEDAGSNEYRAALTYSDRAIANYEQLIDLSEKKGAARRTLMVALFKRSLLLGDMNRESDALRDLDRAETIIIDLSARDPEDKSLDQAYNSVLEQKAITQAYAGQHEAAQNTARRSLERKRKAARNAPDDPGLQREFASNLQIVAEVFELSSDPVQACRLYRESAVRYTDIESRFGLSDYDREVIVDQLQPTIDRVCPKP